MESPIGRPVIAQRIGRYLAATPVVGVGVALVLLVASLLIGLQNDRVSRAEKLHEVQVQARILAGSLSAPLAFDDADAAREYVGALAANPEVRAVGAYGMDQRLVAGFGRAGAAPPPASRVAAPSAAGRDLVVTADVAQGGTNLGSVYLRVATESWSRRAARYLGFAVVVVMACLLIAVLGAFYASVSAANRRLQAEIAGREQAENALRQAQKMEAMGQLTGGVAHDFNNLLMVASSGIELMDRTTDPAKRDRLKQGIRDAIARGAKLTQQLLTFARRSALKPEVVDLRGRIDGMQDLLERSLREDIVVDVALPADLWPIEVDPSQFDVAILNIAINARDAMPYGGAIAIEGHNDHGRDGAPDMVKLRLRDTGAGIPADMIQQVFEPFFTTKGVGAGTGLGLSQVYGFVRSSGGNVEIESEIDLGTTVSLLFPRSLKPPPAAARDAGGAAARGEHARILLAEDDDHVAELVGEMLGELGHNATRACSAGEASRILEADAKRFDLVLSDMIMPGERSGLDLAHEIGRRWPALPIVLMTGYSAAAAAATAEGITLLVKPYTIDALADALNGTLGQDRR